MKRLDITIVGIACFALAWWLYGIGRTMRETVMFTLSGSLSGAFLSFLLPFVVAVPLIWFRTRKEGGASPLSFLVVAAALLAGSVVSELMILRDESLFMKEASRVKRPYSRPRAWPNESASLVFDPQRGVHSTD
jgi:hypothetical protein